MILNWLSVICAEGGTLFQMSDSSPENGKANGYTALRSLTDSKIGI
jgi:hypothetical protein